MSNHPNRSRAAKSAKAYAAALAGAQRVRVDDAGAVHVYGTLPGAAGVGWYVAGTVAELAAKAAAQEGIDHA